MSAYLFQIELPEWREEIVNVIPEHRKTINKLFSDGYILSYSVSMKRDHIWCVINADDEQQAMEIVSGFPLRPFFADVTCHELLFHNTQPTSLPEISLN